MLQQCAVSGDGLLDLFFCSFAHRNNLRMSGKPDSEMKECKFKLAGAALAALSVKALYHRFFQEKSGIIDL